MGFQQTGYTMYPYSSNTYSELKQDQTTSDRFALQLYGEFKEIRRFLSYTPSPDV